MIALREPECLHPGGRELTFNDGALRASRPQLRGDPLRGTATAIGGGTSESDQSNCRT